MRLKEFTDDLNRDARSTKIELTDHDQILIEIKKNAGQALDAAKRGVAIYKGMGYRNLLGELFVTDPKLVKRKSANTSNYYTLFFDNLPSWSNYPKRSESLICSTSRMYAESYGDVFLILPFNSAKIGVCTERDLWHCFRNGAHLGSLSQLNDELSKAGVKYTDNYNEMMLAIFERRKSISGVFPSSSPGLQWPELAQCNSLKDVINVFNNRLSPENNAFEGVFQLTNLSEFDESVEIWTDSKAYMINVDSELYQKIKQNIK